MTVDPNTDQNAEPTVVSEADLENVVGAGPKGNVVVTQRGTGSSTKL